MQLVLCSLVHYSSAFPTVKTILFKLQRTGLSWGLTAETVDTLCELFFQWLAELLFSTIIFSADRPMYCVVFRSRCNKHAMRTCSIAFSESWVGNTDEERNVTYRLLKKIFLEGLAAESGFSLVPHTQTTMPNKMLTVVQGGEVQRPSQLKRISGWGFSQCRSSFFGACAEVEKQEYWYKTLFQTGSRCGESTTGSTYPTASSSWLGSQNNSVLTCAAKTPAVLLLITTSMTKAVGITTTAEPANR